MREGSVSIGEKRFEGYCIDLIYKIASYLGFKYEFELVPDKQHGTYNEETKTWNGLIKRVLDHVSKPLFVCRKFI